MKKYIAGFRSNNKKNKKIAIIFYILVTLVFLIGSPRSMNDILLWLLLMMTPSLVVNGRDLFKEFDKKEHKKIFITTLIIYMVIFISYSYTIPEIEEAKADNNLVTEKSEDAEEINNNSKNKIENEIKYDKKTENTITTKNVKKLNLNKVEIHFIDTGNSDSILIKDGNEAALIDGGENDDENTVVSYLRNQGVDKLKYIIATHPDADHIGGLDAVVNEIKVDKVYVSNGDANTKTYRDFIYAMANKNLSPSVPLLHSKFKLDKSEFEVLSVANQDEPNNNSIVLQYTNGEDKILFMGDAGREIEQTLDVSNVDLIKIGHHGSESSSDPYFISSINPKFAVITCGKNNRYGHPDKETMNTLKEDKIKVYRTDECGDIVFISTGNGLKTNSEEGDYKANSKDNSNSTNSTTYSSSTLNSNRNNSNIYNTEKEGIVYWTPNGKCYHSTKSCRTLSRSKVIYSGTIKDSGRTDPCDICN